VGFDITSLFESVELEAMFFEVGKSVGIVWEMVEGAASS